MPTITFEESTREIRELTDKAERAARDGAFDEAIALWRAVLHHPCAHHQVLDYDVLDEIHQLHRRALHFDEAVAARRESIAAGYLSVPDPEADIAECLLEAGRREEADRLYAELRARDPEDVWLNNSAAFSYRGVDDREALRWAVDGIELAMATGDPDQVIGQLIDLAEDSWAELEEPGDGELLDRARAFQESWTRPPWRSRWPDSAAPEQRRCEHCGWDPEFLTGDALPRHAAPERLVASRPEARPAPDRTGASVRVATAWFPAEEWSKAVRRWPDLLDGRPEVHVDYSHGIEAGAKRLARELPGRPVSISPMTVEGLEAYGRERGEDPGEASTRAGYAAELLRLGQALTWPPGRNQPCWCGSGRKYKQCCGPVPAEDGA